MGPKRAQSRGQAGQGRGAGEQVSHLDLQDVSLMGWPATQNQACTGVQEHHEARGEASHNATATGAHGQGADKPGVQPATQAELVLQAGREGLNTATHPNPCLPEVLLTPSPHS